MNSGILRTNVDLALSPMTRGMISVGMCLVEAECSLASAVWPAHYMSATLCLGWKQVKLFLGYRNGSLYIRLDLRK
jgi:hypothetical protein